MAEPIGVAVSRVLVLETGLFHLAVHEVVVVVLVGILIFVEECMQCGLDGNIMGDIII